ncbi:Ras family GTPase RAS1 [Entamoeba marina]
MQHNISVMVLGGYYVGKTSITTRRIFNTFQSEYDPTIEDIYTIIVNVDRTHIKLSIFDYAGYDQCEAFYEYWFRKSDGFLLVYSISDRTSFNNIEGFYQKIHNQKDYEPQRIIPMCVVGNKIDLESEREVSFEEGQNLSDHLNANFIECSAKYDINITNAFQTICLLCINDIIPQTNLKSKKKQRCLLC